jgi:hypothetical protein
MWPYLITLVAYMVTFPLFFNATTNLPLALAAKLLLVAGLIFYFRKDFRFRLRFDLLSIGTGVLIAALWIGLEGLYPLLGENTVIFYDPYSIVLKLLTGVLLAPVVEEFFTRFFLHRWVQAKQWMKVKQGTFHWPAFIITVLFFGFSHARWLPGIFAGILLNLLWYRKKDMSSIITSHAAANLILGIYVIMNGAFVFW